MISNKFLAALKSYKQADNEGVMVLVSREALDEALTTLTAATSSGAKPIGWVHPAALERNALAFEVATFKANDTVLPVYLGAPATSGGVDDAISEIIRDVCEHDPADPADPDTVSISVQDLLLVLAAALKDGGAA